MCGAGYQTQGPVNVEQVSTTELVFFFFLEAESHYNLGWP